MRELPKGWAATTLSNVVALKTGPFGSSLHQSDYVTNGIPLVNPMHIASGRIKPNADVTVTSETVERLKEFCLLEGDLVLARRGEMGRCAVVQFKEAGWLCGTGSLIVRPEKRLLHADFLQGYLSSSASVKYLLAASVGSTMANLNQQHLLNMDLSLPPLSEQTRIIAKLEELFSDLDAGVAELKAAQKKLAQYRQSLLKAAVNGDLTAEWRQRNTPAETGAQLLERILTERRARWEARQLAKFEAQGKTPPKDWQKKYPEPVRPDTANLPELPEGWVWASVEQLSESVRNGLSKTPNTDQQGFRVFKINAVRPMAVNFSAIKHVEIDEFEAASYWVEVGDVLATRYNGSIDLLGVFGMVKEVHEPTLHPDKLIRMKPVTGVRLGAWMEVCGNVGLSRKHLVSRVKTTAGQTGISGEDLKKAPIPLPPASEQEMVLEILRERIQGIKELEHPTELALKQSTAQRQNILRAAFSGQLVPQDPADEPASKLLERIRAERVAVKRPRGRNKITRD